MKRLLPTLLKLRVTSYKLLHARKKGFTLIELMVVISIIAILSLVSFSLFTGAQGSARDSRRAIEVDALAKNIESTKDPTAKTYSYTSDLFNADYKTLPTDPSLSTGYCFKTASKAISNPTNWVPTSTKACPQDVCAGNPSVCNDSTWVELKNAFTAPSADKYFMVCAASERGSTAICQGPFLTK